MPTATDLVTDLPADFEVFGQAVATSMADLLGGTTGQILSKTSNTDMDFTWTTPNPGDITGVTAGVGISGGGTSGDVTITNSMATAMTTSGDLIQATGSGTFARLGTGTNGQYLTTNGTTNSWVTPASSGAYTLLSTTTMSSTSVTISSINQTYTDLMVIINNPYATGTGFQFRVAPNGSTGTVSANQLQGATASGITTIVSNNNNIPTSSSPTNAYRLFIHQYSQSTYGKTFNFFGANGVNGNFAQSSSGVIRDAAAITSITIDNSGSGFNFGGGQVLVYGVK
jgi:hypothetical protein